MQIVDTSARRSLGRVEGLGDLSHASAVFSPDQRFAYVFGRDGGLTKVDLLTRRIAKRIVQAGNSIGGAISDDGLLVAVSNYEPGGVRVFDAATLEPVADIPADYGASGARSKTVGLVDAPGRRFVFTLYDAGEIWIADFSGGDAPESRSSGHRGAALRRPDHRRRPALYRRTVRRGRSGAPRPWAEPPKVERILDGYGRARRSCRSTRCRTWRAGRGPAIASFCRRSAATNCWRSMPTAPGTRPGPVHGQPVFAVARPDGRQVWVNFAHPRNDTVQVVDVPSLEVIHAFEPGPAVLHLEFTPRGHEVWISVRDADKVEVYDTRTFEKLAELPMAKPSGIFFAARAQRLGL